MHHRTHHSSLACFNKAPPFVRFFLSSSPQTNKQTNKQANKQTNKQANKQASKQANKQTMASLRRVLASARPQQVLACQTRSLCCSHTSAHTHSHAHGAGKGDKNGLKTPNVAIAGVTGAVGVELLNCIDKRHFPFNNLKLLASARSAGKTMQFQGKDYVVQELTEDSFDDVDIALFSAGGSQSKRFAPAAVSAGCVVVDNSSAFRMDPTAPLVVPEVDPEAVAHHSGIIANPNCSTIIMNVAVWPLHKHTRITRISAATYQASSGAGAAAMRELEQQAHAYVEGKPYDTDIFGKQYLWNLFSHNSAVDPRSGYNEEELKMMRETRKIFDDGALQVTATCVRVPVLRAHCEAINLTFRCVNFVV